MKINRLFILGVCSLPFLASCGFSRTSDQRMLNDINEVLKKESNNIYTCHDAIKAVEAANIDLNSYKFQVDGSEFVYDSKAKQFVIMKGDNIIKTSSGYTKSDNTLDYFKSVYFYNPNSKYSQYLDKRAEVPSQLLITTGFDIGDHVDIPYIFYTNESNTARDVIIRTYSDYFRILAPLDTIHHYEVANNVLVMDVKEYDVHATTAYINAENGHITFNSDSTTDFVEAAENASLVEDREVNIKINDNTVVTAAINLNGHIEGKQAYFNLDAETVTTESDLTNKLSSNDNKFIRLESDITYANQNSMSLNGIKVIDLAGYKLSFATTDAAIEVSSGQSLYVLDSQGSLDNNSGIDLHDCYIKVASTEQGENNAANFVVNGGKITQTVSDKDNYNAAIQVIGNVNDDDIYSSNFVMYGGTVESKMISESVRSSTCVTSYGKGANVNIVYGSLESDGGCIAFNPGDGYDSYGGTSLSINGGHFTSGRKVATPVIEYGEDVTITIDGGTFTGNTILSVKEGNVDIKNATFIANGQHRYYYFGGEGSAFNIYAGGESLNLNVTDCNIYSKFAYILAAQEGAKADINLNRGIYSYYISGIYDIPTEGVNVTIADLSNFTKHSL